MPVVKAALLTVAMGSLFQMDPVPLEQVTRAVTSRLPGFDQHPWWYVAIATLVLACALQPLYLGLLHLWRGRSWQDLAPLSAVLAVVLVRAQPQMRAFGSCPSFLGHLVFFVACLWWLCAESEQRPIVEDHLHRSYFADRLAKIFQEPKTKIRRVAIFGEWGSGKSRLLQLIEQRLREDRKMRCRVGWVNPWKARTAEEAWALIVAEVNRVLGCPWLIPSSFIRSQTLRALIRCLPGGELFGEFMDLIKVDGLQSQRAIIARINGRLHKWVEEDERVVLLIDDMERIDPQVLRGLFPVIDQLGEITNLFFVFAIDPDRVALAFDEKNRSGEQTKGYLDKVFDLQLRLPQPHPKDIAYMCRRLIAPVDAPKLDAAWNSIKDKLPVTPREAMHFMRDAIMRETLFLSRYGPEEHDFISFFKLRILAIEKPTIAERITSELVNDFRESRSPFEFLNQNQDQNINGTSNAKLEELWSKAKEDVFIDKTRLERIKSLFTQVLDSGLDLGWARDHHMRLLTLNQQQSLALQQVWRKQAGLRSILDMIPMALPGVLFDYPAQIASELLKTEFIEYESTRNSLISARNRIEADTWLSDARGRVLNLIQHAHFTERWNSERKFYPKEYFKHWRKIIFVGSLPDTLVSTKDLREQEIECSIALSAMLSTREAYEFAQRTPEQIIAIESWRVKRYDLEEHLKAVRSALQKRLYRELVERIRSGCVSQQSFLDLLGVHHLAHVFGDLTSWDPLSDDLKSLRELKNDIKDDQKIASSIKAITADLLDAVSFLNKKRTDCSFQPVMSPMSNHPDYFALIWELAQECSNFSDDLLDRYEEARRCAGEKTPITKAQFDQMFPPLSLSSTNA